MNQLIFVGCLLLCSVVQAAFQDFVIGPESYLGDIEPPVEEDQLMDEDDAEQDVMVSFQDVQRHGVVDTNLLLKALMQHANRLGMSLDELAAMNMGGDDEVYANQLGCSPDQDEFNYQERPTWRDVLFN
ncbi:uncharacterized protein [Drosophila kikkawai]|uniref:Uncharacterized protein n=1 Tax=Drosophila kikkawai TaxID=30033 RepID=A0A6P4II99_DROKI|nr:uncharacterized protein LOC108074688 [Drosophila kikkawai]